MKTAIIGGGISGLALGFLLKDACPSGSVTIYEELARPGGKIWTERQNGFLLEGGVNGFLNNRPKTLELAAALNLMPLKSSDKARKRYVYSRGRLNLIPEGGLDFFKSDLLSVQGRLRIILETIAPRSTSADETLSEFAIRRLGRESYETLIDPMASGIYAGDSTQLSLKSCFPKIYNLEAKYGSLILGMLRMKWAARKTGKSVSAGPGGVLTSFQNGMGTLIDALAEKLGSALVNNRRVIAIEKKANKYQIYFKDSPPEEADILVLAAPAHTAKDMLKGLDNGISECLAEIPYPYVTVVSMAFKREAVRSNFDGFGFLIPYKEGRKILGTLCDSSTFTGRAPEGYMLFRTMLGGARASDIAALDDEKIIDTVFSELSDIIKVKGQPELVKIFRHERAIPQYNKGHAARLDTINESLKAHDGLYLHGNSYTGIGVNDCIEASYSLCSTIMGRYRLIR
ncbi:protoporphyrinogen oxidase [Candidatus Magnetominusculus xianensis]|uniref:Coproporphyrinogen III oxidase n=1 Tax=Candidatus Magnetominusculus xianensis TaxID=1748249 RepID=A0ABR5SD03_9BACT|nr:protoporphyrinogen oxidase [Candidatus Magnetominusculus xianensis]KWT82596.1 protoporphyrinogen oxidase [Candidatus Magnetominusculus xianensis]MBF0405172.1 protoporphyrinogen oxidase [Nitrospirota bacterium]